ncbi:MAG: hypothetical protein OHK0039_09880 [Bacteroidia bacterium]
MDVSAAFALATGNPRDAGFVQALMQAEAVLVPDLFVSEACNTAWKYYHIEGASLADIQVLAQRAIGLPDQIVSVADLWADALVLAHQLDHPVYDCLYLVLARQRDAHLLSLDKRLLRLAEGLGIKYVTGE